MGLSESGTPQIIQKSVCPVPYCTYMTAFDQSEYGDLLDIMAPVTSVTPGTDAPVACASPDQGFWPGCPRALPFLG